MAVATIFMDRLEALRSQLDFPFIVSSGFRAASHDKSIGGAGVHPTGRAVDLAIYGEWAFRVIALAGEAGFTGIGAKQHGPRQRRFIHLDDLPEDDPLHPRPWVWTYKGD